MKRTITIIMVLSSYLSLWAQDNFIVSAAFEPDTCFTIPFHDYYSDTIKIDINLDGTGDVYLYLVPHLAGGLMIYMSMAPQWQWSNSIKINEYDFQYLADTAMIDETINWQNGYDFVDLHQYEPNNDGQHYAFRHQEEDGIHYGWAHIYKEAYMSACVSGFGYCMLPDYPIRWGQTVLLGVEETEFGSFATLHPNPTSGFVTITGHRLKTIEVFNTLGQIMATTTGEGERLTVDLNGLPAGVYFVNITDEEGQKCVRKVVKE